MRCGKKAEDDADTKWSYGTLYRRNLEEDSYRRIEYGINSLSADKANILHKKLGYDLNYIIGGTSLSVEQEYAASSDGRVIHMLSEVISQLEAIEKKMEQKCGEDCGNRNN